MPTIPRSCAPRPARVSRSGSWRVGRQWRSSAALGRAGVSPPRRGGHRRTTARVLRPAHADRLRPRSRDARPRRGAPARRRGDAADAGGGVAQRRNGRYRVALRSGPPTKSHVMTAATDLVIRAEAVAREGADAFAAAASLDDLADTERRYLGKTSALNEIREAIKSVDGSERAVVGKAVSSSRAELEAAHAARLEVLDAEAARELGDPRPPRSHARIPRIRTWSPASGHAYLARARRRVRRSGLQGRRRSRGRARLVQLRGAQLPARAPGARHAGHALRAPRRAARA